ncbi:MULTISPECIES: helix-turn-helix domain-containing protein [unclassified Enterococcus]|uniref:helix-turn-helix transcriptional regulator n=1 Tax=unclassified Enterococcus TaxID=2608891 RepID=UPI00155636C3|nr:MULTISPECIES: helix-turn-helix domain-containing protein [unclassified Enterococcus]MBS7576509.1 helix-turn-helix domain-containing protein [Enterococcus sp. MMGLQ5-2]MBS7585598.1 helix-turn-helix domain-containing protein [Enterococcus sp. MMGLQ5-1]NPD13457.1 helix-turn-helix domain-containing protein [Enterococcus sp. MMGLQ5-1]NPD36346.1 helix-turn-helix domain-containing protein [Enterococcus sp. MMGLQ5-2]
MNSNLKQGEMLAKFLKLSDLNSSELAERLAISESTLQAMLAGEIGISPELALKLDKIFDVPAGLWNKDVEKYLS